MLLSILLACAPITPREAGDRTPLSDACDPLSDMHCLLPFPSNTYTVVDPSTATGLRLDVQTAELGVEDDDSFLNQANGFSRITGVTAAFDEGVDPSIASRDVAPSLTADGPLQVINSQVGSDHYGERMAYWIEHREVGGIGSDRSMVIGRPEVVLEGNADHVFVVTDAAGVSQPETVGIALGVIDARSRADEELAAHYAPVAAFLTEQGVDLAGVVAFSEFTTRSADDATLRMHHMMSVLDESTGDLGVVFDSLSFNSDERVAFIARGHLTNAPNFLDDAGYLVLDDDGLPTVTGETDIEFRIAVPAGDDDYKVTLYGHGTGGDVTDSSFDADMCEYGIAKLNLRFDGWTGTDFVATLANFNAYMEGSAHSTAGLLQSMAGATVLVTALEGELGDALSADTLAGEPNPAAGRRPRTDEVMWMGGSLGGTLGAVIVAADSRLQTAVLNVPGAGWSHMIPYSLLYESGVGAALEEAYGGPLDVHLAMVISQGAWDDVDGAVWADEALAVGGSFLLQESIGDPVLPNLGTNLLANSLGAIQLEPVLDPIHGMPSTTETVDSGAALEQFKVPETGVYDVHGFAARDTIAAEAALEQILNFANDAWDGITPMSHPELCTTDGIDGTCDFTHVMPQE
jgi:hypothetical protein